jgi:hypothetical protein
MIIRRSYWGTMDLEFFFIKKRLPSFLKTPSGQAKRKNKYQIWINDPPPGYSFLND